MAENLTPADIMAVTRNNDGYGADGYGMWFWFIIIIFFAWGNNGFGNNGNNLQTDIDTRFLERDIFSTNQNVSTTGAGINERICDTKYDLGIQTLENRYANQLGLANLGTQVQVGNCSTQKEILESRYDNALANQVMQSQLQNCCCDLKTAIHSEGEETRALIQGNTIQDLRDRLNTANNALTAQTISENVVNAVRPYPTPTYLTCSPYMSSYYAYNGLNGCGCNSCGC
jgi:hypothetical protein